MLWRCRRGLLELDIVLAEFVQQHFDDLGSAQLETLDALLDMPDNQLWDMVTGREPSDEPRIRAMLGLLQSTRINASQSI
jgi:antitoxin CptB